MSVNTTDITSGPYVGNGVTVQFNYDFRVSNKNELKVFETTDLGIETLLTVDTDYTVNNIGIDAGGTIDRVAGALPSNYTWYIRSNYLTTQETSFSSQGGFLPVVHEDAIDKLTFLIQQLDDLYDRCFRLTDSDTSSATLTLPGVADRANKILTFDGLGDLEVIQEIGTWKSGWLTATDYIERDLFKDSSPGNVYITLIPHTSTNIAADLASNKIEIILDATQETDLPTIAGGDVGKILEVNSGEDGYDLVAKDVRADTNLANLTTTGKDKIVSAWVNFDGTGTVSIRDSYNVSSITDNGTGDYSVNFSTAMANVNYSATIMTNAFRSRSDDGAGNPYQTSNIRLNTFNSGGTAQDYAYLSLITCGGN